MRKVIGLLLALAFAAPAAAEPWHGHWRGGGVFVGVDPYWGWGYPYGYPYPAPYPVPYPVPYPAPYPVQGPPPPASQPSLEQLAQRYPSWFYCDAASAYFPYVKTCPAPWRP